MVILRPREAWPSKSQKGGRAGDGGSPSSGSYHNVYFAMVFKYEETYSLASIGETVRVSYSMERCWRTGRKAGSL
jgi:hypothetical protein